MTFNSLLQDLRNYIERGYTAASDPTVYEQLPRLINNAERACANELKVQGFQRVMAFSLQAGVYVYDKPDRWREWISFSIGLPSTHYSVSHRSSAGLLKTLTFTEPHGYVVGDSVTVYNVPIANYNGTYTILSTSQLAITYSSAHVPTEDVASVGDVASGFNNTKPIFPRSYEYLRNYTKNLSVRGQPAFYADYDYYHYILGPSPDAPYPCELLYYELPALLDDSNQTNWLTDIAPNLLLYRSLLEVAPFLKNDERLQTWQGLYAQAAQALTGQDLDKINDRTSDRSKP
jgi:hypothetical protein